MELAKSYENYPAWIVFVSNFVSFTVYLAGAFIIYQIGLAWLALYVAFIGYLEIRLIRGHCISCYYYGKCCAFGKGKLSSLLFRKGNPGEFSRKHISWKDIAPDFMVFIVPAIIGFALLIMDFSWLVLSAVALLLVLGFAGNAFVRGSLACKHCSQRELGCPAERLFSKGKK
ncbi:MAG TPA: hypothetical protein VJ485_04090 [archaeon]|nr:hypothetical protein [archaeon]